MPCLWLPYTAIVRHKNNMHMFTATNMAIKQENKKIKSKIEKPKSLLLLHYNPMGLTWFLLWVIVGM